MRVRVDDTTPSPIFPFSPGPCYHPPSMGRAGQRRPFGRIANRLKAAIVGRLFPYAPTKETWIDRWGSFSREELAAANRWGSFRREELAARREAEASIAIRLDQHQQKVAVYPRVDGRVLQRLGFQQNEVVRRGIDLLVESLIQGGPELQDLDGKAVKGEDADRFDELMLCPYGVDSDITGIDMWIRFWLDFIGTGNAMLEMVPGVGTDRVVRLIRLDPARTHILPHPTERIESYVYQIDGKFFPIDKERVIHFRDWDPLSEFWGIPKLYSGLKSLATDSDLIDLMKLMSQNHGVPPVVLEYPMEGVIKGIQAGVTGLKPSKQQLKEIREIWDEMQGGQNRGKTGLAWGFNVKLIGLDFQKLALSEQVSTTERRIMMVLGIPPLLVGQTGSKQQAGFNMREARELFGVRIGSMWAQSAGKLSATLARRFGPNRRFGWRTDHVGFVRDAKLRRGPEGAALFTSNLLRRHAVQRLIGEPEDGDDIFHGDVYGTAAAQADPADPPTVTEPDEPPGDESEDDDE